MPDDQIDEAAFLQRALANIYPPAVSSCSSWPRKRWHDGVHQPHSSQALCISTFGAIAQLADRADICRLLIDAAGMTTADTGSPTIECEHVSSATVLNELPTSNTPTSVDVLIRWKDAVLTIESKFTEATFGTCSQVGRGKSPEHVPKCSGNFEAGSDLKLKTKAPCRLMTWDRQRAPRLYWSIGAGLFHPEVLAPPQRPCPFAGEHYQLMRNLCLSAALAQQRGLPSFGFLVLYVEGSNASGHLKSEVDAFKRLLLPEVTHHVGTVSYETLVQLLRQRGHAELAEFVMQRIDRVIGC